VEKFGLKFGLELIFKATDLASTVFITGECEA
jgi:hypothetical protein